MLRILAAALAVLGLWVTSAAAAPLEAYGRLPMIEEAQISPDGTMIAYALTDGDKRLVIIRRIEDGKTMGGLDNGTAKLRSIRWAGSTHLILVTSKTAGVFVLSGPRREYSMALSYEIATGKQRALLENVDSGMNVILDAPEVGTDDGDATVVLEGVRFFDHKGRNVLFSVRLRDGRTRMIEPGHEDSYDWLIGPDGEALAEVEYDQKTGAWKLRLKRGGDWATVETDKHQIERPYLAGLGRDGKSVMLVAEDRTTVREYPLDGGPSREVEMDGFDDLVRDPVTHALIGTKRLDGDTWRYTFFDPKAAAAWKGVTKAYPGQQVQLVSWSDNRRRLIVRVEGPGAPPTLALVDLDAKKSDWLGDVYAGLTAEDLSETRPVSYKAKDGLAITGYLTLPRGREAKALPLIVLPHGGPAARDEPGYHWWAQALASRGYAVLQPNFRGSEGFGLAFEKAGYGEFGKKMQTDLSDGVRDLAAQGLIDPKRVCIMGSSYGGYAALAGVTLDPGVYRCAVSIAGLSDLRRMMDALVSSAGRSDSASIRYWTRYWGVEGRRDPDLGAISPITFSSRVDAPVLLIHGKDDTVVLFDQSKAMYDALRKAGKPVELVTLQAEDHWMSRSATRRQALEAAVAFLEKHNPPN